MRKPAKVVSVCCQCQCLLSVPVEERVGNGRLDRQSGSDRLEKEPTDPAQHHHYMPDGALASNRDAVHILKQSLRVENSMAESDGTGRHI
jgi:hypothetical protein